jgi:hypothetical protein
VNRLRTVVLFSIAILFLMGPQLAQAGVLNGHVDAYNDGTGSWVAPKPPAAGAWTGSTAFTNAFDLTGYVDWAVFGPGDFPAGFVGYLPTGGELTYVYQVFSTGAEAVSEFDVALNGPADNIGSLSDALGDVGPTAQSFIPSGEPGGTAAWEFNQGINTGENSFILVFSSPNTPENFVGLTIDGGSSSLVIPVPTPGPNPIPEPSTLVLAGFGLASLLLMRLRRRRK